MNTLYIYFTALTAEWTDQVGITEHCNMNNVFKKTYFKHKIIDLTPLFP